MVKQTTLRIISSSSSCKVIVVIIVVDDVILFSFGSLVNSYGLYTYFIHVNESMYKWSKSNTKLVITQKMILYDQNKNDQHKVKQNNHHH